MNEKIKELALKAGGGLSCIAEPLEHPWKFSERELEKFAELIVAKMLQTCEDHPGWSGRMIGEQIKQDFGVEE
jgi:hypothetical protein